MYYKYYSTATGLGSNTLSRIAAGFAQKNCTSRRHTRRYVMLLATEYSIQSLF